MVFKDKKHEILSLKNSYFNSVKTKCSTLGDAVFSRVITSGKLVPDMNTQLADLRM